MLFASREKFSRAEERLRELFEGIAAFNDRQPYLLAQEFDAETGEYIWQLHIRERFPLPLAVTLGEAIYNLHSGLEHLATAVGADSFPIYKNRSEYWRRDKSGKWAPKSGARKVQGAPATAQTLFEEVQPYNEGHGKHPLWLLRALSNWDKHETLHLLPIVAIGSGIQLKFSDGAILSYPDHTPIVLEKGPLEDEAVVARLPSPTGKPFDSDMQVEVAFAFDQAFSSEGPDDLAGLLLQATLAQVFGYVTEAVVAQRFAPYAEG